MAHSDAPSVEQLGIAKLDITLVPVQRHLQVPFMCPCTGKPWLHVSWGAQSEQEVMSTFMGNVALLSAIGMGSRETPSGFWMCCSTQHLFRIKPFITHPRCFRLCIGCSNEKAEISGPGPTTSKQTPRKDLNRLRAQQPNQKA